MLRKKSDRLRENDAAEVEISCIPKEDWSCNWLKALTNMDLPFQDAFICHEKNFRNCFVYNFVHRLFHIRSIIHQALLRLVYNA